jgi:hypothetical protein
MAGRFAHHTHHAHDRRQWQFTPVVIDPRCEDGAPVRCLTRFPDDFVDFLARKAHTPAPPALYMANANPSPRNELGDQSRPWLCLDCSSKRYDLGDAVAGAQLGFVMVRLDDDWTAYTWADCGAGEGEYREPF